MIYCVEQKLSANGDRFFIAYQLPFFPGDSVGTGLTPVAALQNLLTLLSN